jgi:hypothetical protein
VVLTGDHGVAPTPESTIAKRMPGGRIAPSAIASAVQSALAAKFGEGAWVSGSWDLEMYLNLDLAAQKRVDPAEVRREAAAALRGVAHMFRVYTRDQLLRGEVAADDVGRRVLNGFHERRGADIVYIPDPYWIVESGTRTTHGGPFGYDNHVPVIFMGRGVRAGYYDRPIVVNDIAPTLARILDVETPSGSVGRILNEMFE